MAVAADAFFGSPTERMTVAGVTGTNGKTTTTYLVRSILEADGRRTGMIGTVEWVVGGASRAAPHTTPEAIDLQRLFGEMLEAGDEAVALEASSHGSHYRRLDRVRFDALAFTNLTPSTSTCTGTWRSTSRPSDGCSRGRAPARGRQRRRPVRQAPRGRAPRRASGALVTFGLRPEAEVRAEGSRSARAARRSPRRASRSRRGCWGSSTSRTSSPRSRRRCSSTWRRTRSRTASAPSRACPGGSSQSTRARRSRSSSTTRTSRTRSRRCSTPRAAWDRAG